MRAISETVAPGSSMLQLENLTAANPSGTPCIVTARLECIRMPQTVGDLRRPASSRPLFMLLVMPIASSSRVDS